jgi:hypothetical protein
MPSDQEDPLSVGSSGSTGSRFVGGIHVFMPKPRSLSVHWAILHLNVSIMFLSVGVLVVRPPLFLLLLGRIGKPVLNRYPLSTGEKGRGSHYQIILRAFEKAPTLLD